jgi:TetR/AcrR family transcriptional regulator, repressor for uid operon
VMTGIDRARRETTLMGRMAAFIAVAMEADTQNPSTAAFLATAVLESQRHPELRRAENDSVRISREFLAWAVGDAIERGEIAPDTDVSTMAETLLVVLCGVGFYAGFVGSYEEIETITTSLGQLMGGRIWRPPV